MAEGTDLTSVVDLGQAHLRVARPTDDLEAVVRFYRDGPGLDLRAPCPEVVLPRS